MKPIKKIEAGAEQMYDEISQSITAKYNEITEDLNDFFMKQIRTLTAYSVALALLLGGMCAFFVFLTYGLAAVWHIPVWQVAGIVGAILIACGGLLFAYFRHRTNKDFESETTTSNHATKKDDPGKLQAQQKLNNRKLLSESEEGMERVKDGLSELISPTYHIRKNPFKSLAIAIAAGALLGMKKSPAHQSDQKSNERTVADSRKHSRQSRHSTGLLPAAYALIAPLVINAVRQKVVSSIEDYVHNFDFSKFKTSEAKRSATSTGNGFDKNHDEDSHNEEEDPFYKTEEEVHHSHISYLKH